MLWKPISISAQLLTRALRAQRLGDPHITIRAAEVWMDADEEREADAAMWSALGELDLLDRRGGVDAGALDSFGILSRPTVEYFAYFTEGDARYRALIAYGGGESVVAFRDGDTISLHSIRDESPQTALIGQLPEVPPAKIDSLNVRVDGSDTSQYGVRDKYKLQQLTKEPLVGQGELYVGLRDYQGHYASNIDDPIRYNDYASGRVLATISRGYLSVAPASRTLLAQRLAEVRHDLAR